MNQREFMEGVSEIDEELLERSERNKEAVSATKKSGNTGRANRIRSWRRGGVIVAAALLLLCVTVIAWKSYHKPDEEGMAGRTQAGETHVLNKYLIAAAKYPEALKQPISADFDLNGDGVITSDEDKAFMQADREWGQKKAELRYVDRYDHSLGKAKLLEFNAKVMKQFLKENNHENRLYSPINIYMALGMLAETSEGNTRKQVLDLLGMEKVEDLRTQVKGLWLSVYKDDKMKSVLAASVWLRDDITYNKATMDILAQEYYASSFAGKMGSEEYSKAFQSWLNEQTDGILKEQISGLKLDPQTVMALATTVCFSAKWSDEFRKENTKQGMFHAAEGDVQRDFMNDSRTGWYFWGDQFGAIRKEFDGMYGFMLFILPDEGVSVYDLLADEQVLEYLEKGFDYENKKGVRINASIPKFDVSSDSDLTEDLKKLGITDAFDENVADFSPVSEEIENIWISKVQHGVRVIADEEGVKAAAYTAELAAGAARPPEEEIDFVLDRPFLFVISMGDGTPMFVGIVENP